MAETAVAELLPGLYREVLDSVATLERYGRRRDADRLRAQATGAYSKAWDHVAARRLERLRDEARRLAAGGHRARPAWRQAGLRHDPAGSRSA